MSSDNIKSNFRLIEVISDPGDKSRINEDTYCINKNQFMVADGASSIISYINKDDETGGYIAAHLLCEVFNKSDSSIYDKVIESNTLLNELMVDEGIDVSKPENRFSAACAAISIEDKYISWVQAADSLILFENKDGSYELSVNDFEIDREGLTYWEKLSNEHPNMSVNDKRLQLDTILKKNRGRANKKDGYSCVNGQNDLKKFILSGRKNITNNLRRVFVFTDGMIPLSKSVNDKVDFTEFIQIYNEEGLKGLLGNIRILERDDPNCIKWPRYKMSDDATAMVIEIIS